MGDDVRLATHFLGQGTPPIQRRSVASWRPVSSPPPPHAWPTWAVKSVRGARYLRPVKAWLPRGYLVTIVNGLDWGKIYRKAPYLMGKSMVNLWPRPHFDLAESRWSTGKNMSTSSLQDTKQRVDTFPSNCCTRTHANHMSASYMKRSGSWVLGVWLSDHNYPSKNELQHPSLVCINNFAPRYCAAALFISVTSFPVLKSFWPKAFAFKVLVQQMSTPALK